MRLRLPPRRTPLHAQLITQQVVKNRPTLTMVDVDDEAPPQHPLPATMSKPHPASNPPPHQFANNRISLPDIRPICALADAAEAVSRIAMNGGITLANDNDNAAILASLSTSTSTSTSTAPPSLLPHPRGGNVVSPTTQLFSSCYECTTTTTPSASSSLNAHSNTNSMNTTTTKQSKPKRFCSVPICTNIVVRAGVCVTHGAKLFVCQIEGCNRTAIADHLCVAHTPKPKCEIPGCSMHVPKRGVRCYYLYLCLTSIIVVPLDPETLILLCLSSSRFFRGHDDVVF